MPCIVFTFIGSSYSSAEEDVAKATINAPLTLAQDAQVSFIPMDDDIPTMMIIHWKGDPFSKPFKTKSEATTALGMDPAIWNNYKFSK